MSKRELIEDVKTGIKNLERLNDEMKNLLAKITDAPGYIEIRAAASILHDFYSSIEKIFERIAVNIDKNLPKGENWHIELLSQMAKQFNNERKPVISEDLFQNLKEYLKFRHLFRHIYGFELKWERIKQLCIKLDTIFERVKFEIGKFLEEQK